MRSNEFRLDKIKSNQIKEWRYDGRATVGEIKGRPFGIYEIRLDWIRSNQISWRDTKGGGGGGGYLAVS